MSGRYLGRRLVQTIVTIAAIVLLNFILFRLMPGSPERILFRNPNLSADVVEATRIRWGLDKPLIPDQLVAFVGSTLQGDLGYSFKFRGQPVTEVIADRIGPTLLLVGLGEIISAIVGIAVGALAGWRRGGLVDRIGSAISLILYSMPYFVIGMPLIIIFAAGLGWFPTSGMQSVGGGTRPFVDTLGDLLRHLALPLATVALGLIGQYSILMRSAIIETRTEDYVTTARAKGLPDGRILWNHAFPNAMLPMITLVAINLGYVIAGAITAEIVFSWPGLGTLTITALSARDYPVLQGIFLLLAISVVLANLVADLLYGFFDPRVRA
jgi:peptide/nickel transport system permease protein